MATSDVADLQVESSALARRSLVPEQCALVVVDIQEKLLPPIFEGERVLPEAEIEVWVWETDGGYRVWRRRGEPLKVSYEETFEQREPNHGD